MTNPENGRGDGQRRLVLVVGVGRSGTSLLTGILGELGFRVPEPEIKANETNPRGFGEPEWVVELHSRLLSERRVIVFDSRPDAWDLTASAAAEDEVFHALRSWLAVQFVGTDRVVVKDPRIGWFLPLWRRCADDLGVEIDFITMLRNPAEVLDSARRWYGTWQNDASRATAWLNQMLHTERATRADSRSFIRYDALLADWAGEIDRVGRELGLPSLRAVDPERAARVAGLVDASLHRSKAGWQDISAPDGVRRMLEETWQLLSRLADTSGDGFSTRTALDEQLEAYIRLYRDAEEIAQSSIHAARPRKKPKGAAPGSRPAARGRVRRARARASRALGGEVPLSNRVVRIAPRSLRQRIPLTWRRRALASLRGARRRLGR